MDKRTKLDVVSTYAEAVNNMTRLRAHLNLFEFTRTDERKMHTLLGDIEVGHMRVFAAYCEETEDDCHALFGAGATDPTYEDPNT